jgi:DNA-binding Lrp family transcriptional regulator
VVAPAARDKLDLRVAKQNVNLCQATIACVSRWWSRLIVQGRRGRTTKGQDGMLSAYVLIESEVGKVARVAQAMAELDGVQLAEDVAGPYDVIARVEAPGLDELGRLIVFRIQVLDGVTRTLTCMVLQR